VPPPLRSRYRMSKSGTFSGAGQVEYEAKVSVDELSKHNTLVEGASARGSTREGSRINSETSLMSLGESAWPSLSRSGSSSTNVGGPSRRGRQERQEEADDLLEDALVDSWAEDDDFIGLGTLAEGDRDHDLWLEGEDDEDDDEEEERYLQRKARDLDNMSIRGNSAFSTSKVRSTATLKRSRKPSPQANQRPRSPSISRLIGAAESEIENARKAREDSVRSDFRPQTEGTVSSGRTET